MGKLIGMFSGKNVLLQKMNLIQSWSSAWADSELPVASSLVQLGHQVLAVDANAERVQNLADELPHITQADTSDPEVLKQLSVMDFAHVVVSIGHDMEASVLTTLNLNQMGARDIWVKANSEAHGRIVQRLGAHHVIFPERDMGERVAHLLMKR